MNSKHTEESGGNTTKKKRIWKPLEDFFNKHNFPIYFKPFGALELLHPEDLTPKHKAILYISAMKNVLTCTSRKQSNCCISTLKGKTLRAECRWFKWAVKKERLSYHPFKAITSLHQQFNPNLPNPHEDNSYWSQELWRLINEKTGFNLVNHLNEWHDILKKMDKK